MPQHLRADFRKLLTAARNWRTEILAYFDHPVTNAYTEALNGVAKVINRQGRGYTFEVLRARVLFGKGVTTVKPEPQFRCGFARYVGRRKKRRIADVPAKPEQVADIPTSRKP